MSRKPTGSCARSTAKAGKWTDCKEIFGSRRFAEACLLAASAKRREPRMLLHPHRLAERPIRGHVPRFEAHPFRPSQVHRGAQLAIRECFAVTQIDALAIYLVAV